MTVELQNLTASAFSFLAGALSVPANSTVSVPISQQSAVATDGQIRNEISSGNLLVTDGTNAFAGNAAINYLYLISLNIVPIGQGTAANSRPVVLASDQSAIPLELEDGSGNPITSQVSGSQRALDVGIDVAGVQIDPRQIRALTASDIITANQGSPNSLADKWPVQLTDGTNAQAVKAASTAASATDPSAVVALSPNSPLPSGSNTIGGITQVSGPWTQNITEIGGSSLTLGQEAMAASIPVVIASNQTNYPVKLEDGSGNSITSQTNGSQRALDIGIDVAGVQVDPRQIRTLTATDTVTVDQGTSPWVENISQFGGNNVVTGTGVSGSGIPRVTVSNDSKVEPWDGTNTVTVKAASTASVTTDTALVTAFSPNTSLPVGTNIVGALVANQTVNLSEVAGTATVTAGEAGVQAIGGNVASGSTDSGYGVKVSGVYNTTVPSIANTQRSDLQTDSRGALQTTRVDGFRQTYSAGISELSVASSATDFFTIKGSASKVVRILRIEFAYSANVYGPNIMQLIYRSSADTGGTSTALTAVPHDSNNSAATAVVNAYTANPTLGTTVGVVRAAPIFTAIASNPYPVTIQVWDFGNNPGQAFILRGTAQQLALNAADAVSLNGAKFSIDITWTEE